MKPRPCHWMHPPLPTSAGSLRIIIPGGTGYVGGRICEHLAALGHEVVACSRRAGIWRGVESVQICAVDWRQSRELDEVLQGADAIIMLAAANEIDAALNPVAAADATSTQCLAWLEAAARQKVRRFLYFSTIHVYGANDGSNYDECREPRPVHPYASTHLAAEVYVQAAHSQGQLAATIFRLSNAFGAPVDPTVNRWTLLVNDLARQAIRDGRLRLRTDGLQQRDFIGLQEVCRAVEWTLQDRLSVTQSIVFNLGSGVSESVYQMALRVSKRAGLMWPGDFPVLRATPRPNAAPQPFRLDVTKLAKAGFTPTQVADREIDELLHFCKINERLLSQA
jgi:UDP-glucose 4-epimerase